MPERQAAVAALLERLLTDPEFRSAYRSDPAAAARAAGFGDLAPELALPARRALETLEVRESRQALAGVMMAAAVEGAAIMAFSEHVVPGLGALLPHVEQAQAATPRQGHAIADQLRMEGSGGPPTPETLAVLENHNIVFDASGIADLRAGRIDPRIVSVLGELGRDHKLVVSALCSDHPKLTSGGSVSNHYYGRAMDIAAVDGKPVSASNAAAHEVALALNGLDPSIRPSEVGSPWALPGSSDFTDAAHQNHLHVAFDDPISAQSQPAAAPAADAAPQAAPAPAGAAAAQADSADSAGGAGDDDAGDEDDGDDTDAEGSSAPTPAGDDEDENEPDENEPDETGPSDGDSGEDPDSHDDNSDAQSSDSQDDNSDADEDPDSHDDNSDAQPDQGSDGSSGGGEDDPGQSSSSGGDAADPGGSQLGGAAIDYPGDGAASEKVAAWMGGEARRRGLPPELPVMASLVESGMTNADHGDADSLGFFQMRASVWDSGPYAGYAGKPKLQLQWFLDSAERVKQDRQRRGLPMDEAHYGEWIADVERPAAQYRGRYQLRLAEARELLRKAGDGKGAGNGAELAAGVVDSASMTAGPHALAALTAAEHQLGVRYVWGGASPKTGFDCSGLVQWAYARAGIKLPRVTEEQILAPGGKAVSRGKLLPGDLVFFRNASGDVHHVGISLGGDRFIGAPHTGDVVKVASLREPSYAQEFAGGRRFDAAVRVAGRAAHARVLPTVNP